MALALENGFNPFSIIITLAFLAKIDFKSEALNILTAKISEKLIEQQQMAKRQLEEAEKKLNEIDDKLDVASREILKKAEAEAIELKDFLDKKIKECDKTKNLIVCGEVELLKGKLFVTEKVINPVLEKLGDMAIKIKLDDLINLAGLKKSAQGVIDSMAKLGELSVEAMKKSLNIKRVYLEANAEKMLAGGKGLQALVNVEVLGREISFSAGLDLENITSFVEGIVKEVAEELGKIKIFKK